MKYEVWAEPLESPEYLIKVCDSFEEALKIANTYPTVTVSIRQRES